MEDVVSMNSINSINSPTSTNSQSQEDLCDQVHFLFDRYIEIAKHSDTFLDQLISSTEGNENGQDEAERLGSLFLQLEAGKSKYEQYITNLPHILNLLADPKFCDRVGYCIEVGMIALQILIECPKRSRNAWIVP